MIRHLTQLSTLSALTAALLLGACSKNNEEAGESSTPQAETASAEGATADAGADADAGDDAEAALAASFWPAVAPLVAGTYKGQCLQLPEMKHVDAAIALAADGKASASGIEIDLSKSTMILLSRDAQEGGAYSASATLAVEGGGAQLRLDAAADARDSKASLLLGERHLSCDNAGGMESLRSKPLHAGLAKLIDVGSTKLKCVNAGNLLNQPETTLQVRGGVVTIGEQKFELDKAVGETVQMTGGSNGFTYSFRTANGQQPTLMYNGAGKIVSVMGVTMADKKYICGVDEA